MRRACLDAIVDLAPSRSSSLAEYEDFLRWLEANHFTFLGHRRYRYVDDPAQPGGLRYEMIPGSALGILRRDEVRLFEAGLGGGEQHTREQVRHAVVDGDPAQAAAGYNLALGQCRLGQKDDAEATLKRLLLFAPDDQRARSLAAALAGGAQVCSGTGK